MQTCGFANWGDIKNISQKILKLICPQKNVFKKCFQINISSKNFSLTQVVVSLPAPSVQLVESPVLSDRHFRESHWWNEMKSTTVDQWSLWNHNNGNGNGDGDEMTSTIICCSEELSGSGCFHWLIVAVLTDHPEWSLHKINDTFHFLYAGSPKFSHQVVPLAQVTNLASKLPGIALLYHPLWLSWYLHQPESYHIS